jgi:hypothetical protein
LLLFALFFFIFTFSIISADSITVFISIVLYLIFLIPFFQVLNDMSLVVFNEGYDSDLFNSIISYSKFIIIIMGIFLFIELIYVSFFS